ncbi:MAG: chemotaxis protein CheW [Candidatus Hodarchaeota archaeon]
MTTVIQTEKAKNRHLIFRIAEDLYGLEVHYLKEVFQTGNILKLPRTSSVLEGIVNLRGYIVSIFNLSVLLWGKDSHKEDEVSDKTNIILLVTIKDQDIGILVDQIHQLDTITEFKSAEKSYFQGRELLNPSLVSKVGLLDNKQTVLILDLEGLLGDFITSKKSERKMTTDEDFDFNFDQYTLPDPDEASEISTLDASNNYDIDQLNLPENLQTDEFDQSILDKVDEKGTKREKKTKSKKDETQKAKGDKTKLKDKTKAKKSKKTKESAKTKNNANIKKDSKEEDKSKRKDKTEVIKKAETSKKDNKNEKDEKE